MSTQADPKPYLVSFDPPTREQATTLHASALVTLTLSLVGSAFIVAASLAERRFQSIGDRYPFYISLIKLSWSITHTIDHSLFFALDGRLPHRQCQTLGGFLFVLLSAEGVMAVSMSLSMFAALSLGWPIAFGSGDWILLTVTFGVPAILVTTAVKLDALGGDLYFCFFDTTSPNGIGFLAFVGVSATTFVIVPILLYLLVIKQVRRVRTRSKAAMREDAGNASENPGGRGILADHVQRSVLIKTCRYTATILVTFVPAAVFGLSVGLQRSEQYAMVFWVVCTVNAGGCVNAIAFIWQRHLSQWDASSESQSSSAVTADPGGGGGERRYLEDARWWRQGAGADGTGAASAGAYSSTETLADAPGASVCPALGAGGGGADGVAETKSCMVDGVVGLENGRSLGRVSETGLFLLAGEGSRSGSGGGSGDGDGLLAGRPW
ncbi:hypothetical protein DFJ73DRAFT_817288 [Zopfochytrium polystomum]|nr:hypothetical protein DFJ73DRAFT_817288 [Zopfochytrium polystomum]